MKMNSQQRTELSMFARLAEQDLDRHLNRISTPGRLRRRNLATHMSYLVYGNGRHGAQLVAFVRGQANPHSKTWARIEAALSRLQKQQQAARPEEGAPIPQKGRAGHPAFSCIPAWELDENAKRAEVAAFFEESGFTAEDLRAFTGIAPEVLRSYIAGEAVPWQARLAILVEAGFAAPFEEVWEYTSAERREQALRLLPAAGF